MAQQIDVDMNEVPHAGVFLLTPLTQRANVWFEDNVDEDTPKHFSAFIVEGRDVLDAVMGGLREDGLVVC